MNKKNIIIIVVSIITLIAIGIAGMFLINKNKNDDDKKVSYTQLIKDIKEGKIQKVEMNKGTI